MELPFGLEWYHIVVVIGIAVGIGFFLSFKKGQKDEGIGITKFEPTNNPLDNPQVAPEKPTFVAPEPQEAEAPLIDQESLAQENSVAASDVSEESNDFPDTNDDPVAASTNSVTEITTVSDPEPALRLYSKVDPEIEAVAVFKPRLGAFTTDQLYQVASFVHDAKMEDIVSLDYFNEVTGSWSETPRSIDECTEVHLSMLLVNRSRHVDEITMGRFIALAQQIVIELNADALIPDAEEVLHKTQYLMDLIEKFDNSLILHVVSEKEIDREELARVARNNHFVPSGEDFVSSDGQDSDPVYTLSVSKDNACVLEMRLDIALSNAASQPLVKFLSMANEFACRLDGQLQDVSGNAVTSQLSVMIDAEMERLYATMRSHGIVAGSVRARRLFVRD